MRRRKPTSSRNGAMAASLIRDTVRYEIAARHEDSLRWFSLHPATPEDLLIEIYESGLCRDDLGHRQGPRVLLERLANESKYPEAIVTLALQFYTDSEVSTEEFKRFLDQHAEDYWMLDTLVRGASTSPEKESLLEAKIATHVDAARLKRSLEVGHMSRRAEHTSDSEEIDRLYAMGEPAIWLALAKNRFTSRSVLVRLSELKDFPLARHIRNCANDALRTAAPH